MKREVHISCVVTKEEEQEINSYLGKLMTEGTKMTKSDLMRETVLKYIRNGKPVETPIDDKQEDLPITPHNNDIPLDIPNPYADLHF